MKAYVITGYQTNYLRERAREKRRRRMALVGLALTVACLCGLVYLFCA